VVLLLKENVSLLIGLWLPSSLIIWLWPQQISAQTDNARPVYLPAWLHLSLVTRSANSQTSTFTGDGPKFGRRRSSAEEFGRMFGSVRLGNMWLFGRSSAELRQTFGVFCGFFAAKDKPLTKVNKVNILTISY